MPVKKKISRDKGVQITADLLYAGKARKEICEIITKDYNPSIGTIDKWIQQARAVVAKRTAAAEEIRAKAEAEQIEEIAKELGISRKTILAELRKVAFMDVRKMYKEDGTIKKFSELDDETAGAIAGVEVFEEYEHGEYMGTNRKVRSNSKLTAIAEINKLLGYYPATVVNGKVDPAGPDGQKFSITLNLG